MKIYVNHEKFQTLEELFTWFFERRNQINAITLTGKTTYFDEKCKQTQCAGTKYRSMDDLYYLANTYFPETDIKEVFSCLLTLNPKGISYGKEINVFPHFSNCITMARIRFLYHSGGITYQEAIRKDSYTSLWKWKELFDMLNIKSNKALTEYINKKIP